MDQRTAGDDIIAENANWRFGGEVAKRFDGHVVKSVPFYNEGHEVVLQLSDFFLKEGSICYELGCSTGALTEKLGKRFLNRGVQFIGLDCESDMVAQAQKKCQDIDIVEVLHTDIIEHDLQKSDLIISYYTIQFVSPKYRQALIDKLYQSLNWGGALLLFEKVRAPDARFQDMMTQLYSNFKISKGYTPAEILGKANSLKGVLEPFSTQGNLDLLQRAGFVDIMTVFKYLCFEGFLAIK